MTVTEYELSAILDHCRALLDAAEEFASASRRREGRATVATFRWEGEFRDSFVTRVDHELVDLANRVAGLRGEADEWAAVWADSVNEINRQRRQAAVDRLSQARGTGEQFVDFFVGDDSHEQVREVTPVPVPTAASRYAATGGLDVF